MNNNYFLAQVNKEIIFSDYNFEEVVKGNPFFDDLVYYHHRNLFVPEIFVEQCPPMFKVQRRHLYFAVALKIDLLTYVNVVVVGSISGWIKKLEKENKLKLRNLSELSLNDRITNLNSEIHIVKFENKHFINYQEELGGLVLDFFSNYQVNNVDFYINKELSCFEYKSLFPKFEKDFMLKYLELINYISQNICKIACINGKTIKEYFSHLYF